MFKLLEVLFLFLILIRKPGMGFNFPPSPVMGRDSLSLFLSQTLSSLSLSFWFQRFAVNPPFFAARVAQKQLRNHCQNGRLPHHFAAMLPKLKQFSVSLSQRSHGASSIHQNWEYWIEPKFPFLVRVSFDFFAIFFEVLRHHRFVNS